MDEPGAYRAAARPDTEHAGQLPGVVVAVPDVHPRLRQVRGDLGGRPALDGEERGGGAAVRIGWGGGARASRAWGGGARASRAWGGGARASRAWGGGARASRAWGDGARASRAVERD